MQARISRRELVRRAVVATVLLAGVRAWRSAAAAADQPEQEPRRSRAYVVSGTGNFVAAIDTDTNAVVGTIPVRYLPTDVAVTPDGARVYVTTTFRDPPDPPDTIEGLVSNDVSAIDTASGTVVARVPVGRQPRGLAADPSGQVVYVATYGDGGSVAVVDRHRDAVVARIRVQPQPARLALAPDGARLYVSHASPDGTLTVVDTARLDVVDWWPLRVRCHDLAVAPDGGRVYLTDDIDEQLWAIDTGDDAPVPIRIGGRLIFPRGVAIAPDGSRAYVASGTTVTTTRRNIHRGGFVSAIDLATNESVARILVGAGPFGLAITADGTRLYVTNTGDGTVSVVDTSTDAVTHTLAIGDGGRTSPLGIAIAP